MAKEKIYLGRVFNPRGPEEFEELHPGYLAVDAEGRITDYGPWDDGARRRFGGAELVGYGDRLILPGFIDVHLHLPQLDVRGCDGAELLEWLEKYVYPAESAFADPDVARATARRLFQELARNGTSCAAIYSSIHAHSTEIAFEEAADFGIRAIIGKVLMDRNASPELEEDPNQAIEESLKLYERWENYDRGRLHYAFTPRFAPACSEGLRRRIGEVARERRTYIQTHLAETEAELRWVRELFPRYKSYTEVYHRLGILGPRTVVGHAVHLGEDEYRLLAETGTKVAHCPSANLFLHSGRMRLWKMDEHRIEIGLGSDIGAGPSLSMFDLMRDMYYLNRVSPLRAFYHATLGGARVLGLEKEIGSFAPGKEADFIVVDPSPLIDPGADMRAVLSQLVFRGDDRQINATYVRGRRLYSMEAST
ncbi:MAG: guanine deaminase [Candidatus Bipolaricaulia bacterium]